MCLFTKCTKVIKKQQIHINRDISYTYSLHLVNDIWIIGRATREVYSCLANCEQSPVPRNFSILGNEASIIPKLFTKSNVVSIANIPSNS